MNNRSERAVLFLCLLAAIFGWAAFDLLQSRFDQRLSHMTGLRNSLELYKRERGTYPLQGKDSLVIGMSRTTGDVPIDVLAPRYIAVIPRDPQLLNEMNRQYLYFSNGVDFKIVAHGAEDFARVARLHPELIDPVRPTVAYGFWTQGAVRW